MTAKEIAASLAEEFNISKANAVSIAKRVLDLCVEGALEDGRVTCHGHIFTRKEYAARTGHNPRTGEKITIPAKTKVTYKQPK